MRYTHMTIEDIRKEYEALEEKDKKVTLDVLEKAFKEKIKPYLGFIGTVRTQEGRPNEEKLRKVLLVTLNEWDTFKKLPIFREHLDFENDYMKYEARKAVIDLVREQPNAKAVELQLKVFDPDYGNKKTDTSSLPKKIRVDLYDARLEDEAIEEKSGIKSTDDI